MRRGRPTIAQSRFDDVMRAMEHAIAQGRCRPTAEELRVLRHLCRRRGVKPPAMPPPQKGERAV